MTSQISKTGTAASLSAREQREIYLRSLTQTLKAAVPKSLALTELRSKAEAIANEHIFPSTKDEDWRFTDLKPMLSVPFQASVDPAVDAEVLESVQVPDAIARLVLVNGRYSAKLSTVAKLPAGVIVGNLDSLQAGAAGTQLMARLAQAAGGHDVFTTLNTIGFSDVAVVWVSPDQVIDQPIHIVNLSVAQSDPIAACPRCLIVAERHSALTVIEDFYGIDDAPHFTNSVTEIWADENAQVNHVRLQREGTVTFHIGKTAVTQGRDSRYVGTTVNLGAHLSRHNFEVYQTGPQTDTSLNGLAAIATDQLADTHSLIALNHPHGTADQLYKCIVDDQAHAIFNGKVWVSQKAQMTNASQLNRNLLLANKARVDTKPELDIVADNVKCAHGATVSQLNADEVFYLQSRGIDTEAAQRLLIYGFAMEIIERIPVPSLQKTLIEAVTEKMRSLTA